MRTRQIPIVVKGGLDTKSNPKLVAPGAALQIDNMFQQRPGEWTPRNGMTTQTATTQTITAAPLPYASPAGGVSAVVRGLTDAGFTGGRFPQATPARFGAFIAGTNGWENANGSSVSRYFPYPFFAAATDSLVGDGSTDIFDGDIAKLGQFVGVSYLPVSSSGSCIPKFFDSATGRVTDFSSTSPSWSARTPICVSTSTHMAMVGLSGAPPYTIQVLVRDAAGTVTLYSPAGLGGTVLGAGAWYDVIRSPTANANSITIAWRANAGGVSVATVDLTTGTVSVGPVNFAAYDANLCLGFVDWTGNTLLEVALAMIGTTNGVRLARLAVSTLAQNGLSVIDGAATAANTNVTGHWDTLQSKAVILWTNGTGTPVVKRNDGSTVAFAPSFTLYSRTALGADGRYYFVGAYASTVQPSYALMSCDDFAGSGANRAVPVCYVMQGEGGGVRSQSSLTSLIASGSNLYCALPRKKRATIAGIPAAQGRIIQLATFSDALTAGAHARELGGVTYLPGGLVYADDGQSCRSAVFPRYPETPTLASSAGGGGMTSSKTYGYRLMIRRQDNSGRIIRSAASVPVNITLGAADNTVTVTVKNPYVYWTDFGGQNVLEVYRVGPIESGNSLYNLVLTSTLTSNADTFNITDTTSDATAATGEVAYFTGNVEEHIAPPSCSLLEVNGGRIWLVNAEDPSELRYSKISKPGTIPGFTPDFYLRVDGDGRGAITALGSMDGRLVVFKDGAIWVVSGDGPDDTGSGSFARPQSASRDTGIPAGLARSVVSTPDGLMFQSARGIYLLSRGLGLEYIGAPVEAYTLAANVVDASTVRGFTQARFVMASGRCLVWDYQAKAWSTFILPVGGSTIVACVDSPQGWYYVTADGKLRKEVAGATTDDGTAIIPVVSLPYLNFAGLAGYQRLRSLDILIDVLGNHTFGVSGEFNYSGALTGAKTIAVTTATPTIQVEYLPPDGSAKCSAMRPVLTVIGSPAGATFRLTSVTAIVGIKSGTNIADAQKMG